MGLIGSRSGRGDPLVGEVLQGRYRVEERIGAGGMGTVYRAVQVPFERQAAIKVLAAAHSDDEAITRRFAAEALIISRLRHPNTLKPYDFGRTPDGRLYIVTEYLEGHTLADVLRRGPIDAARTLRYLAQVCDALSEAHERGIIHRDLKPANIFIERVGRREVVKVLDFGVAKVVRGVQDTEAGKVQGTPAYMSPEQAEDRELDARSDLYAIGIIAYECLTGRTPFTGPTPASVLLKHLNEQPAPLREVLPGHRIRADLEGLVLSLLEKDRARRPYSAEDVRQQIEQVLLGAGVGGGAGASLPGSAESLAAVTPDPFGATVYAGAEDSQLVSRLGVLPRLRGWVRRTRAAKGLLLVAAIELVAALALGAWAAHMAGWGATTTEEFAGPPVEGAGGGDAPD